MDALLIEGQAHLKGEVVISGSKNSTLPLLFSLLLFDGEFTLENVPRLWDVETTLKLLEIMGCQSKWEKDENRICLSPRVTSRVAPYEWVKRMRASILALGPLVARCGEAWVSLPGGCAIGARPVNFHLEALKQMGVTVEVEEGYIHATVKGQLVGATIDFPEVTVTGTENILIAAAVAEGTTVLRNAACEPEVIALGNLLQSAGAEIRGLGTRTIEIVGRKLKSPPPVIQVPPDRIETGTWIAAAIATRSPLTLNGCDTSHLDSVLKVYREMGCRIEVLNNGKTISIEPEGRYRSVEVETAPYPGFPTDMQAQLLTTLCLAEGKSTIVENIFENRFMHVAELVRLGANIKLEGNRAIIQGPAVLKGAPVMATDLRASASLVVAGLAATGQTRVSRIYHLDRGYQRMDEKLRRVGAKIIRVAE